MPPIIVDQPFTAANSPSNFPVRLVNTGSSTDSGREPAPGAAHCMSGGGYHTMLSQVGALCRLKGIELSHINQACIIRSALVTSSTPLFT